MSGIEQNIVTESEQLDSMLSDAARISMHMTDALPNRTSTMLASAAATSSASGSTVSASSASTSVASGSVASGSTSSTSAIPSTTIAADNVPVMPSSGLLIVDKPQGVTSHDVVAAARSALHTKKVGHAGTLDPMATGLLVIGFGNATRLLNYIVEHDKTYEATIRLGARTTTDDADGELIVDEEVVSCETGATTRSLMPSRERIETMIAERFTGDIEQVPNTFSAIKINGKRAYDLAREGKDVELRSRPVHISEFIVLDAREGYASTESAASPLVITPNLADETVLDNDSVFPVIDVDVRVSCSSGTYIRALARDLGEALGVGGYLTRLRRTRVGRFDVAATNTVTAHTESRTFTNRSGETVTRNRAVFDQTGTDLAKRTLSMMESVQIAMPTVQITAQDAVDLRFGRRIPYDIREVTAAYVPANADSDADVAALIVRVKRGEAKPIVVFPAS